MKGTLSLIIVVSAGLALIGCTDKSAATKAAQEDAAAKARAEALRKEMNTAPKVFSNLDMFKKNDPAKPIEPVTTPSTEKKK